MVTTVPAILANLSGGYTSIDHSGGYTSVDEHPRSPAAATSERESTYDTLIIIAWIITALVAARYCVPLYREHFSFIYRDIYRLEIEHGEIWNICAVFPRSRPLNLAFF